MTRVMSDNAIGPAAVPPCARRHRFFALSCDERAW